MAKIITVSVYRKDNNEAYPNAKVTVGGHSNLSTTTDRSGRAVIHYPYSDGSIDIYVNGETAYSGFVGNIPGSGIVAKRSYW